MPNTRSQDFRYTFANTFGLTFGPSEIQLVCGIQTNPGSTEAPIMEEQAGIVITHGAGKLLVRMLDMLIADFEEATGREIEVDPDKLEPLEKMIEAAKAARNAPTGSNA